jgi:uncharacterized damage-inducible protein DinB
MNVTLNDNIVTLKQGELLLCSLSNSAYTKPALPVFASTIGAHIRHNLDHYACFLEGLSSGFIDYSARQRDSRIEQNRAFALAEFARILDDLSALDLRQKKWCVLIDPETGPGQTQTTIQRELEFLLSHTIHHYAMVAVICRLEGLIIDQDFGVAPSTLRYRSAQATACAR